jgi:hypothetical protein
VFYLDRQGENLQANNNVRMVSYDHQATVEEIVVESREANASLPQIKRYR